MNIKELFELVFEKERTKKQFTLLFFCNVSAADFDRTLFLFILSQIIDKF